ncbi:MAG: hypothetical protein INR71_06815 [Terriglobus roseus]|nr:hypothetical protein [Terriglobus roseus]
MSYYFAIVGTQDNPLFEHEFGTSRSGGDGVARFREEARHMNQFVVHGSLDVVDEAQWAAAGAMYLRHVDRFHNNYVSCFAAAAGARFMLLHNPDTHAGPKAGAGAGAARAYGQASSTYNPAAPAVEEAIKNFFVEVYEVWVKTVMNPFYKKEGKVTSPVFRARVAAAARKYL